MIIVTNEWLESYTLTTLSISMIAVDEFRLPWGLHLLKVIQFTERKKERKKDHSFVSASTHFIKANLLSP